MGNDGLSDLGIIFIESDTARSLDLNELVDEFANEKGRKKKFPE